MIRDLTKLANELGELKLIPETDAEVEELHRCHPPTPPEGYRNAFRYEGDDNRVLVLFVEKDPYYKPAPKAATTGGGPGGPAKILPVPSREELETRPLAELITTAAELGVTHKPGETKANLVGKILPAWEARNKKMDGGENK